jgi:hypothetical protein
LVAGHRCCCAKPHCLCSVGNERRDYSSRHDGCALHLRPEAKAAAAAARELRRVNPIAVYETGRFRSISLVVAEGFRRELKCHFRPPQLGASIGRLSCIRAIGSVFCCGHSINAHVGNHRASANRGGRARGGLTPSSGRSAR